MEKLPKIKTNLIYSILFCFSSVILSFGFYSKAKAEVVINGQHFQGQDLELLEYVLGPISPGRYWLNTDTGNWGYEGDSEIQGNILEEEDTQTNNSQTIDPIYDPYSPLPGSMVQDPDTGCSYISSGDITINTCDNW